MRLSNRSQARVEDVFRDGCEDVCAFECLSPEQALDESVIGSSVSILSKADLFPGTRRHHPSRETPAMLHLPHLRLLSTYSCEGTYILSIVLYLDEGLSLIQLLRSQVR